MFLKLLKAEDFRLFESVELDFDRNHNLIFGDNASGKTTILEAISYLGRGRSFRNPKIADIVRWGSDDLLVYGKVENNAQYTSIGVMNGKGGLQSSINGDHSLGIAGLAKALPLQVIDPNSHNLISGSPEERRRYIDWILFHVEPKYIEIWRKYKRALKQRNAALKNISDKNEIEYWNKGLSEYGEQINKLREDVFIIIEPVIIENAYDLIGSSISMIFEKGWSKEKSLLDSLNLNLKRDIQYKNTTCGPHRADIRVVLEAGTAKDFVSRGQQKLLACALITASVEIVQMYNDKPLLLLVDDPKAELDRHSTSKLMKKIAKLDSQVIATSIDPEEYLFEGKLKLFHVEHKKIKSL